MIMVELECIPLGAGHAHEGVCILLKIGSYRILYDCGLPNIEPLAKFQPSAEPDAPPVDLVICSHAHADHAEGLLALHRRYPTLPIYASEVTAQLLPLNWSDVPHSEMTFCQPIPWRAPILLAPNLTLTLYPAGHLPGAAVCLLTYLETEQTDAREYTVLYTGDFLLSNARLVDGLPLAELRGLNPDVLILEGSFGTARHPHRRQQETQFTERVLQAIQRGQSVLIPVPILGLGQELLMLMRSHHTFTGKDVEIWVEESIAQGCDAYLQLLTHLPATVRNFAQHQPLFWDERVRPRVRRLSQQPQQLVTERPCVVLVNHAHQDIVTTLLSDQSERSWLILQPEHRPQAEEADPAPATELAAQWDAVSQHPNVVRESFLLAEHCDGPGTTQLIHNLRPQHVVFMHGSPSYLADLTGLDELASRYHLHSPGIGTCLELPIGEELIHTTPPVVTDALFEGEVHELENEILVTLPPQLMQDPRWRNFVDTGLLEASWQGEVLVLRGISQRELLTASPRVADTTFRGCANCQHYQMQRCWNPRSTLYNFKVAPDGYCPFHEGEDQDHSEWELQPRPLWPKDQAADI
jgi:Cft2 family RNA processing exonuclease